MPALLFGSISSVADTSEQQRFAFNQAFEQHGLDWRWDREDYQKMLTSNGGQQRIADYAAELGVEVDAQAVHATKSQMFQQALETTPIHLRPGVTEAVTEARKAGWKVGLVTTTSPENVAALFTALDGRLTADDLDIVVDSSAVESVKPAADAYVHALDQLGVDAADAVAIEDNVGGAQSARTAGVPCLAFPNENTVLHDFGDTPVTRRVDFESLRSAVSGQ